MKVWGIPDIVHRAILSNYAKHERSQTQNVAEFSKWRNYRLKFTQINTRLDTGPLDTRIL